MSLGTVKKMSIFEHVIVSHKPQMIFKEDTPFFMLHALGVGRYMKNAAALEWSNPQHTTSVVQSEWEWGRPTRLQVSRQHTGVTLVQMAALLVEWYCYYFQLLSSCIFLLQQITPFLSIFMFCFKIKNHVFSLCIPINLNQTSVGLFSLSKNN